MACYVNQGRLDAALAFNRSKDLRRVMPLIKSRGTIRLADLRNEAIDLRSVVAA